MIENIIGATEAVEAMENAPGLNDGEQVLMSGQIVQDAPVDPNQMPLEDIVPMPLKKPSAKKGMKQTKTPNHWQEVGQYFNSFHKKKEAGQKAHDMYGRDIWGPLKGDTEGDPDLHDPYIGFESRMRQIRRWAKRVEKSENNGDNLVNDEERGGPIQQLLGEVSAEGERLAAGTQQAYPDNIGLGSTEGSILGRRSVEEEVPQSGLKRSRN